MLQSELLWIELGRLLRLDEAQAGSDRLVLRRAIDRIEELRVERDAYAELLGEVRAALAAPDDVHIVHYSRELRASLDASRGEVARLRQQVADWSAAVAEISSAALEMAKELESLRVRQPVVVLRAERLDGGE